MTYVGAIVAVIPACLSAATATITWTDNSWDELGFKIERSDNGGPFSQIDTVGPDIVSYVDSSISDGVEYDYRVRAYNNAYDSTYSNVLEIQSPVITTQPTASLTRDALTDVTLTVSAVGQPAPSFQWKFNGENLSGEIGSSLNLTDIDLLDAGTYTVTVSNSVDPAATSVNAVLNVTLLTPAITTPVSAEGIAFGQAVSESAFATGAASVPGSFSFDAPSVVPATAGDFSAPFTFTPTNLNAYTPLAGSVSISVAKANQTISFPAVASKTFNDPNFGLAATSSSALPVSYSSSNPAVATVSGNTVAIVGAGSTTFTASQPGDNNYNAASAVTQSMTVAQDAQSINFAAIPTKTFGDDDFSVSPTATSGLAVSLSSSDPSVATVTGGTISIVGAGSTTITAAQAGDGNYLPATSIPQTLTVNQAAQSISFGSLPAKTFGDADFMLNGSSSAGLTVSYTSSDPSVATINGNTVVIVGAGAATITASQAGNANVAAATDIPQTLTVNPAAQSIAFPDLTARTFGDADFALAATSSSGLPISYSSSNPAVATITGSTVTIVGVGSTSITASQVGNENYEAATEILRSLTVNKASQFISFAALASKSEQSAPFGLTALASSGLPVSYASSNPAVATVAGDTVTIVGFGATVITATQSGSDNYLAATAVAQPLDVIQTDQLDQSITFDELSDQNLSSGSMNLGATASSGLAVAYSSSNPAVASVSGNVVTFNGGGVTNITASQPGNDEFLPATSVTRALQILAAPSFLAQPTGAVTSTGGAVTLHATATGYPAPTLQWRRDGVAIAGATTSTLSLSGLLTTDSGIYDVIATNSQGSSTSAPAAVVVNAVSYAGDYFGTFSNGSEWALHIKDDNTGVFIAYLQDRESALVIELTVREDGSFNVEGSEFTADPPSTNSLDLPPVARAQSIVTLTGTLADGVLSASIPELSLSLTGGAESGSSLAATGYYRTAAADPAAGVSHVVVAPNGRVMVVTVSNAQVDGASGTLDSTGSGSTTSFTGGSYRLALSSSQQQAVASYAPMGSESEIEFIGVADDVEITTRLVNLSVRSDAGQGDGTLIAGFVISGSGNKSLMVRAVGPGLTEFGVPNALSDPNLRLYSAADELSSNDNWESSGTGTLIADLAQSLGAFPLASLSRDAVLNTSLVAGTYTSHVGSTDAVSGNALLEVYDAAKDSDTRLSNLSVRTHVGTGSSGLVMGFVIEGNSPITLLIRAVGPTLADYGLNGVLSDPQLTVFNTAQETVAENDNWGGSTELSSTFIQVGAFDLSGADSKDAALVLNLTPGAYTVLVSGVDSASGISLAEIYEIR